MDPLTAARLTRRLDWRFLLPDPRLGRVAFVGRDDSELLRALQAHGERVVHPFNAESAPESVDVIVAQSGDVTEVGEACRRLAGGGALYWELPASRPWEHTAINLAACGIRDIRAHWHYGGFDRCRWVVPLEDGASVAMLLARVFPAGRSGWIARTRLRASAWIAGQLVVRRLVPTSLVGLKR